jgi:hypothetical protein
MTISLDIGCGPQPKNPFNADQVVGIDIREDLDKGIHRADLIIEPIPFGDDTFDFVSAYDFLEHVPRILYMPERRHPFVELMNEIYRVLKMGGHFVSFTPAYPHGEAFRDPTHVNIITEETFLYFNRENRWATMYGYKGAFNISRQEWQGPHLLTIMQKVPAPPPGVNAPTITKPIASGPAPSPGVNRRDSDRPRICVVSCCFNEASILPLFIDHYLNFFGVTKIVLFDGGSTDGSDAIAARYPEVEFRVEKSEKVDDRALLLIRNEAWKPFRTEFDWMIVCDVDEFLYCDNPQAKLREFWQNGVTLPLVEGFEMYSKTFPTHTPGRYLWQEVQTGKRDDRYNKSLLFDSRIDINFIIGCHACNPKGPVVTSAAIEFKLLHYCMLSYESMVAKSRSAISRLSDWNRQTGSGAHRASHAEMSRLEFNLKFFTADNVIRPLPPPRAFSPATNTIAAEMLGQDLDVRILQIGLDRFSEPPAPGCSAEFYAWFVHCFSGEFVAVDPNEQAVRDTRRNLASRLGELPRTHIRRIDIQDLATLEGRQWSVVHFSAGRYDGDEGDLAEAAAETLDNFIRIEQKVAETAIVVVDHIDLTGPDNGHDRRLSGYLVRKGFTVFTFGRLALFIRHS